MASSRKLPNTDPAFPGISGAIKATAGKNVKPGQRVAVCLSGGVDSVVLLHALITFSTCHSFPLALGAIHVNHGLQPQAGAWESFCQRLCASFGVTYCCERVTVDKESGDGLEGAARRARQEVFRQIDTDWLMLAHHMDDQAETLLFNLLRGAGIQGASAMHERNGRLLRPFLAVSRSEILAYARHHGLEWVEDESNADPQYSRNYLRLKIIPEIAVRFPALSRNLAAAASRFGEAQCLLDDLARLDLGAGNDRFPLPVGVLLGMDEGHALNALRYLLKMHQLMIPSESRLREALQQMLTAAPDRHPEIVLGEMRLRRRKGQIYLERVDQTPR